MSSKRPLWVKSAFSQPIATSNVASASAKKSRSCEELMKSTVEEDFPEEQANSETISLSPNWSEKFAPQCINELAVHAKKIEQVQNWLENYEKQKQTSPAQIFLVSGPAGSGKTATIRVLSKELKYELIEWINPIDTDLLTVLGDQDNYQLYSQVEMFTSFLFRSSRYTSVLVPIKKRLILVEDFPNIFIKEPDTFSEILNEYSKYGRSPLLFIATDSRSKNLNISHNLFPENIKEKYNIVHISFNAVATTLMTKAIKRICDLMALESFRKLYAVPPQNIIDSIIHAAQGDIRNAVVNLHFASLQGAPSLTTESVPKNIINLKSSSRSRSKQLVKLKSVGRHETITMMHALGRVFNPKYVENERKLVHQPEEIADAFATEPKYFLNFIHANYIAHFSTIEDVITAADSISISDIILDEYREDSLGLLGLNIAVRGVMVGNVKPVSGWMSVRGPKRIENCPNIQEELRSLNLTTYLSRNLYATDFRTYVKIISKKGG